MARVLRPNGLVLLSEIPPQLYDIDYNLIDPFDPDESKRSWAALFFHCTRQAMTAKGGNPYAWAQFDSWMQGVDGLERVGSQNHWIPLGKCYHDPCRLF